MVSSSGPCGCRAGRFVHLQHDLVPTNLRAAWRQAGSTGSFLKRRSNSRIRCTFPSPPRITRGRKRQPRGAERWLDLAVWRPRSSRWRARSERRTSETAGPVRPIGRWPPRRRAACGPSRRRILFHCWCGHRRPAACHRGPQRRDGRSLHFERPRRRFATSFTRHRSAERILRGPAAVRRGVPPATMGASCIARSLRRGLSLPAIVVRSTVRAERRLIPDARTARRGPSLRLLRGLW